VIPPDEQLKHEILQVLHDVPTMGHPGRDETFTQVSYAYWWPGMRTWITNYVAGCTVCQQNKNVTHRQCMPLYRIPTPEDSLPFQQIALDLITGLPPNGPHDSVLTIVDHGYSRAAVFLPCATTITGLGVAQLYFDNVYRWFRLPSKVISDRDPCFTSHFRRVLASKIGAKQNLSTAFHPQTDRLSERKNQWVEQYLHLIANTQQEDWSQWLTVASAVHNDHVNATLGVAPSEILLGYQPTLHPDQNVPSSNQTVEQRIEALHQKRTQAIAAINKVANQGHTPEGWFKEGDQVWLEATNLKLPYHTPKLAPRWQGPFRISKVVSPVAYQLTLPLSWGIHNVFHASLLLPYKETTAHGPNFMRPPRDLIKGKEEYKVEAVINHRYYGHRRQLQYLIKWKDYPSLDNTWETAEDVHVDELVKEYHRRHPLELLKTKAGQGTRRLAHTLQLFATTLLPTQKVTSWLLHSITPPTARSLNHLLTPKSPKDKLSTSTAHLKPMFITLNANTLSSTPAFATTPTANTTPTRKPWASHPVKCPDPPTSRPKETPSPTGPIPPLRITSTILSSSRPRKRETIRVESNMPLLSSLLQERPISFREAPTSSTCLPYCIDQHGHLYMRDPSPQPSSESSVLPSPTQATKSIKDWLMTSWNWSTAAKKKVASVFPSSNTGSRGSRTTSANSTPTSKIPSAPSRLSQLALTYMALPYLGPRTHPDLPSSHLAFTSPPRLPPHLPFLGGPLPPSHHPSHRAPPSSGRGHPL